MVIPANSGEGEGWNRDPGFRRDDGNCRWLPPPFSCSSRGIALSQARYRPPVMGGLFYFWRL